MLNETILNSTFMYRRNSLTCTVANNANLTEPFNGLMRHLIFSREVFSNNSASMRGIQTGDNLNILSYFRLDSLNETVYRYNKSVQRNLTFRNVTIDYLAEPEQVCYCQP